MVDRNLVRIEKVSAHLLRRGLRNDGIAARFTSGTDPLAAGTDVLIEVMARRTSPGDSQQR